MPWTAGVYTRGYASWSNDAANNLPISATKFDTEDNDFASGLNNCLTKDGLNGPSGAMTWGLSSAQALALTRGSDGNIFSIARTSGTNNPGLQFQITDAGLGTINQTYGSGSIVAAIAGTAALTLTSSAATLASALTVPNVNVNAATVPANGVYLSATNTLAFATNTTARGSINATGQWSVLASTSGTTAVVAGVAGITTFASSTPLGLTIIGATGATDYTGLDFAASVGGIPRGRIGMISTGAGSQLFFGTSNAYGSGITNSALEIDQNGRIFVAAPTTAAAAVTVTANAAGQIALTMTDGTNSCSITANATFAFNFSNSVNFQIATNNALQIASTRAVTVAAPTAGHVALTVNGVSGTHSSQIADSATNLFNTGFLEVPQNSQSANYTTVLSDNGKHIYHPASDANARTFTIDSNANVAQPIGATHTFVNDSANNVTIAITSDTLLWAPSGGTGSRTLAQFGKATAIKVAATRWWLTGVGLT